MKQSLKITAGLLVLGFAYGVLSPDIAAEEKLDPVGAWQLHVNRPGRPANDPVLRVERAGDKLVGVLTDPQGRSTPVKDIELKGDDLSFKIILKRDGQDLTMTYKAKLTKETLNGNISISLFGQMRSFPFEGKRKKDDATLAGSWKITLALDSGQKLQPTFRLKQEGSKLSGEYIGNTGKEAPLQDVQFKNGELSFRIVDQFEEDKVPLAYAGKVTGNAMAGTVKLGAGNQTATMKFEAQKIQTPTANVAGIWKLKVPFKPDQVFEPTLKLTQTGSVFSGVYAGEQGETKIADALIMGDEFTFEVARDKDGKKYRLRYQGKVKGDTLKGNVDYDFDGIAGFLSFDGQRVAGGNSSSEKKQ
jgi:hypothetical protein